VPAINGYDEPAHAGYMLTLVREGRLPNPLEGWSTFHPPLYYVASSVVWQLAEPFGPHAVLVALRLVGVAATLLAGAVSFRLLRQLGTNLPTTTVATLLTVFVPCRQLATTMLGNEAMAAALVAVALLFLVRLQRDPRRLACAVAAGVFAGLALATKYTALALLPASVLPFLRTRFEARERRAAAALAFAIALIAGPIYARNVALTGTPLPMTRTLEPMRSTENTFVLRPRLVSDYLWVPWGVFRNPTIFRRPLSSDPGQRFHREMLSVWGLVHAGVWWDPFERRVPWRLRVQGSWIGTVLTTLGLVPTLLCVAGFAAATRQVLKTRLRAPDAPLTVFAWCTLALFISFTWRAPSLAAVKASYLLPAGVPAAWFFARGVALLGTRVRRVALAFSAAAAIASAVVFTEGLVFDSPRPHPGSVRFWSGVAERLPGAHLVEPFTALGLVPEADATP